GLGGPGAGVVRRLAEGGRVRRREQREGGADRPEPGELAQIHGSSPESLSCVLPVTGPPASDTQRDARRGRVRRGPFVQSGPPGTVIRTGMRTALPPSSTAAR